MKEKKLIENISLLLPGIILLAPFLAFAQVRTRIPPARQQPSTYHPPAQATPQDQKTDAAETLPVLDTDVDGIDDNLENRLLERFRPYYKFSYSRGSHDKYRPADVMYYLRCSELNSSGEESGDNTIIQNKRLAAFPNEIFLSNSTYKPFGSAMITQQPHKTSYHLNPLENVEGISGSQPGRTGNSWEEELSQKNIGLYGHVVPIWLQSPRDYDRKKIPVAATEGLTEYYKIEYWQFFGFNETGIGGAGNHEGDWTTVQVLYNRQTDKAEAVFHYAHGQVEFRFILSEAVSAPEFATPPQKQPVEVYKEYRGRNYDKYGDIGALKDNFSHNTLRMLKDPVTREYAHPFVYIEWGAHEFWPTEAGFYPTVPTHSGTSYSFLTGIPLNLGEVEYPGTLPGNRGIEAMIITRFNGYWGSYGGPPTGPSMHYQWTWPASSSIRWQMNGDDLTD